MAVAFILLGLHTQVWNLILWAIRDKAIQGHSLQPAAALESLHPVTPGWIEKQSPQASCYSFYEFDLWTAELGQMGNPGRGKVGWEMLVACLSLEHTNDLDSKLEGAGAPVLGHICWSGASCTWLGWRRKRAVCKASAPISVLLQRGFFLMYLSFYLFY